MNRLLIISLLITLHACDGNYNSILLQAEQYIETSPDSACAFLNTIPHPEKLTGKEQADYALLTTQALYKTQTAITSDSLINIAVNYYKESTDYEKKALAYLYKGIVSTELGNHIEALSWYKQAERLTPRIQNAYLNIKINEHIAYVSYSNYTDEETVYYDKQAYHFASITGDKGVIARTAGNTMLSFRCTEQPDSALQYLHIALDNATYADSAVQASIYQGAACFYIDHYPEKDSLSLQYLHKTIQLHPNKQNALSAYSLLAQWYSKHNEPEKADSLWTQVLTSTNIHTKAAAYCMMAEHYEIQNEHARAHHCLKLYNELHDSIEKIIKRKEVAEILYRNENSDSSSDKWSFIWIIIPICLLVIPAAIYIYRRRKEKIVIEPTERKSIENYDTSHILLDITANKNISQIPLEVYEDFFQYYNRADKHFINQLEQNNTKMTPNQKMYCILIRLEKNDEEIRTIMACSDTSLRMTKTRLRNKFNLKARAQEKVLEQYIRNL